MNQGDILTFKDGSKRKILGVCGEIYHLSTINDFKLAVGGNLSLIKKEI